MSNSLIQKNTVYFNTRPFLRPLNNYYFSKSPQKYAKLKNPYIPALAPPLKVSVS